MKRFSNIKLPQVSGALEIDDYQFHDRVANGAFVLTLLVVVLQLYFVLRNYDLLPPEIPFFLTRVWGVERLAPKYYMWFVPLFVFVSFLINYGLALVAQKQYLVLARVLSVMTMVLAILSGYALWSLVNLVIVPII